jgi:hypothetical protein
MFEPEDSPFARVTKGALLVAAEGSKGSPLRD